MKSYIISVILTAVGAFVAVKLSPDGRGGTFSPYVRLISSLALICVMISPITSLLSCDVEASVEDIMSKIELESYGFYESGMTVSLSKINASTLSNVLSEKICEKFDLERDNVSVEVKYTVTPEKTEYNKILVLLSGKAIFKNPREIENFVYEICNISCDCALK